MLVAVFKYAIVLTSSDHHHLAEANVVCDCNSIGFPLHRLSLQQHYPAPANTAIVLGVCISWLDGGRVDQRGSSSVGIVPKIKRFRFPRVNSIVTRPCVRLSSTHDIIRLAQAPTSTALRPLVLGEPGHTLPAGPVQLYTMSQKRPNLDVTVYAHDLISVQDVTPRSVDENRNRVSQASGRRCRLLP